jgi:hypothetical protein
MSFKTKFISPLPLPTIYIPVSIHPATATPHPTLPSGVARRLATSRLWRIYIYIYIYAMSQSISRSRRDLDLINKTSMRKDATVKRTPDQRTSRVEDAFACAAVVYRNAHVLA